MSPKSTVKIQAVTSFNEHLQQVEDRIRVRAYDRFVQRGRETGRELEDWCGACSDLLNRPAIALSELDDNFVVHFLLPNEEFKGLELLVSDSALLLQSSADPLMDFPGIVHVCEFQTRQLFRVVEFPRSIAPDSVAIESEGRMLRVKASVSGGVASTPKTKTRAKPKPKTRSASA